LSQADSTCPACFASIEPKEITWAEFKARLIKAGWREHEADEEIAEMQKEEESGM